MRLILLFIGIIHASITVNYKYSNLNCTGSILEVNAKFDSGCDSIETPPVCRNVKYWECIGTLDEIQVPFIKQTSYYGNNCNSSNIQFQTIYKDDMCLKGRHYACDNTNFILSMSSTIVDPTKGLCGGNLVGTITHTLGECVEYAGLKTTFECHK